MTDEEIISMAYNQSWRCWHTQSKDHPGGNPAIKSGQIVVAVKDNTRDRLAHVECAGLAVVPEKINWELVSDDQCYKSVMTKYGEYIGHVAVLPDDTWCAYGLNGRLLSVKHLDSCWQAGAEVYKKANERVVDM